MSPVSKVTPQRDPSIDHPDELYPEIIQQDDLSDVQVVLGTGRDARVEQVAGENVDEDGVAHFLRISPDPDVPDSCGGCNKEWPCPHRVPLQVLEQPRPDAELVQAVAAALREERDAGRLAL